MYIHLTRIKPRKNVLDEGCSVSEEELLMMDDESKINSAERWQQLDSDQTYLAVLYDKMIVMLTEKLNNVHQSDYSHKYWRILIGPWLRYYLYVLYRRYQLINKLYLKCGRFKTIALDKDSFICPLDTEEFIYLTKGDKYNLQIYTRILDELGLAEITERVIDAQYEKSESYNHHGLKSILVRSFFSICIHILKHRKKIILVSPYFPKKSRLKFFFKSFGRIVELPKGYFSDTQNSNVSNHFALRKNFCLEHSTSDVFERLCYKFIGDDLPKCFVENYSLYKEQATIIQEKIGNVSGIVSSNSWYGPEVFKMVSALVSESGKSLYGLQHGGNYGNCKMNSSCYHELDIVERFYSWGWGGGKVTPRPCTKLVGVNGYSFRGNNTDILYGLTSFPRFDCFNSEINPSVFNTYLQDQKIFISKLCSSAFRNLVVRPHHEDFGWETQKRLAQSFDEIKFETMNGSFLDRIKKVRLYVCDHLSTTHIEALALGVPTILFWPLDLYMLTDEAIPYYQLLEDVGVLFHNPVNAAEAVPHIYQDVESWWLNPKRQEAVAAFVDKYGKRNNQAQEIWFKELISLVDV